MTMPEKRLERMRAAYHGPRYCRCEKCRTVYVVPTHDGQCGRCFAPLEFVGDWDLGVAVGDG